ncbi:hypothetical protein D9Q98_006590 [Chlorella vulgaris]|uniref:Inosine triphosphate pyrophosphatase n=1 Tax=Chlorella vulgaris TaxID=3077 RepID=A0A9D4TKP5_CHLVU|nr:hypothetical protein D9Q98_006590 [Chlorella vulgaris]
MPGESGTIHFVTGNANKARELAEFFASNPVPFNITPTSLDLPEIQGDPEEIAMYKCSTAMEKLQAPVLVEDVCLGFNALHGLPGPYIKQFLQKLGHDGLNRMLQGFEDQGAVAMCTVAYCAGPGCTPVVVVGKTEGKIVPARGPSSFGWDPIFEPAGSALTYGEMTPAQKSPYSHRHKALKLLRDHLLAAAAAPEGQSST